jgi:hypothetical protein
VLDAASVLVGAMLGALVLGLASAVTLDRDIEAAERALRWLAEREQEIERRVPAPRTVEGGQRADAAADAVVARRVATRGGRHAATQGGRRSAGGLRHLKRRMAGAGAWLLAGVWPRGGR